MMSRERVSKARARQGFSLRGAAGVLLLVGASLVLADCATVTSTGGGDTQRVGDMWFVRTPTFFGYALGAGEIWYCPVPAEGSVDATCTEAEVDESAPDAPEQVEVARDTPRRARVPPRRASPRAQPPASPGAQPVTTAVAAAPAAPEGTANRCSDLRLEGSLPVLDEVTLSGFPEVQGGVVADGTYVVTRYQWFARGEPHSYAARLRIHGQAFEITFRRDEYSEQQLAGHVMFQPGGRVAFQVDCPWRDTLEFERFGFLGNALLLVSLSQRKVVTFTREPLPDRGDPLPPEAAAPRPENTVIGATPDAGQTSPEATSDPRRRRHHRPAR